MSTPLRGVRRECPDAGRRAGRPAARRRRGVLGTVADARRAARWRHELRHRAGAAGVVGVRRQVGPVGPPGRPAHRSRAGARPVARRPARGCPAACFLGRAERRRRRWRPRAARLGGGPSADRRDPREQAADRRHARPRAPARRAFAGRGLLRLARPPTTRRSTSSRGCGPTWPPCSPRWRPSRRSPGGGCTPTPRRRRSSTTLSTGVTGLIDWAGACPGPLLYDVASAVMYLGGSLPPSRSSRRTPTPRRSPAPSSTTCRPGCATAAPSRRRTSPTGSCAPTSPAPRAGSEPRGTRPRPPDASHLLTPQGTAPATYGVLPRTVVLGSSAREDGRAARVRDNPCCRAAQPFGSVGVL